MSKTYTINWTDRVDYSIEVEANSPEEALKKFNDGEGYSWSERVEENVEYITYPWVDTDWTDLHGDDNE